MAKRESCEFLDSRDNKIRGVELLVYQEKTRRQDKKNMCN